MRIRKSNFLLGILISGTLFLTIYLLYSDSQIVTDDTSVYIKKDDYAAIESKLSVLEVELSANKVALEHLESNLKSIESKQKIIGSSLVPKESVSSHLAHVNKTFAAIAKKDYEFASSFPSKCDINMKNVYDELEFSDVDGGAWKQGWPITYNESSFSPPNKLKVIVMPHSHNDPGWIKTFEKYYKDQTKKILDNMVVKLREDSRRKFIWAEISYLNLWWEEQPLSVKGEVVKLLKNGQLEIVTGGWVMNDEANTHYAAMVEQLISGHEWCRNNLGGFKPNYGWAIDPFGMTPTMAYVLTRMGFDGMLIQRTHYEVKKYLAQKKSLEFKWRQHWDHGESTDILTHMMPFYSYDVPHTCGPEPKICCQFDFDRLPGMRASCPWGISPKPITPQNVKERAKLLIDQYKKKAQLYKTNVVLAPLGDDFRYDKASEWDQQFNNYQAIFDYVNEHPELNTELQFGTLSDYFKAAREVSKSKTSSEIGLFPSLSGDFFTYADIHDSYWSGYFTSRPFYKSLDRILGGYLRSAEIMYSMLWAEMEYTGTDVIEIANPLMEKIVFARQNYGLFQHHDGVTGTAKSFVMKDYGKRMTDSINELQTVLGQSTRYLLFRQKSQIKPESKLFFEFEEIVEGADVIQDNRRVLTISKNAPSALTIFNSLPRKRQEVVSFTVDTPDVRMYKYVDYDGEEMEESIIIQLSPIFDQQGEILNTEYTISFVAEVEAFAIKTFYLAKLNPLEGENPDLIVASTNIYNSNKQLFQVPPFSSVKVHATGEPFSLQNAYLEAYFDSQGFLEAITNLDDKTKTDVMLNFFLYRTRKSSGEKSGAYLFTPDGPASKIQLPEPPIVRVTRGNLVSKVEVFTPTLIHTVSVFASSGIDGTGLRIENRVDVRGLSNAEVAMRIEIPAIQSGDRFVTDLNGFSSIARTRLSKLPIQGNYYPVASLIYIEDQKARLSLVSRQPLGGSSLNSGELEVMLDRRLMQDDNRGLGETVTDNVPTISSFFLLFEKKTKKVDLKVGLDSYPSLLTHAARNILLNPLMTMHYTGPHSLQSSFFKSYKPVEKDLGCDIDVLNLRTMQESMVAKPSNHVALILHRHGFNPYFKGIGMSCSTNEGSVSVHDLFPDLFSDTMHQMTLSLMYNGTEMEKGFTVSIKPMELYSFRLRR